MARRTTAHLFTSVNGVAEDPHLFQHDAFGAEEGAAMGAAIAAVTDVVIGRTLWEEWSQHFPGSDDPFADFINPVRKHVVSRTLSGDLAWNSTAVDGDPLAYVERLRAQDGGDISVVGGISTTRTLFLAGVIDTLSLTVHPAITGVGRRLFDESVPGTRLELVEARSTSVGNVLATYRLRPDPA